MPTFIDNKMLESGPRHVFVAAGVNEILYQISPNRSCELWRVTSYGALAGNTTIVIGTTTTDAVAGVMEPLVTLVSINNMENIWSVEAGTLPRIEIPHPPTTGIGARTNIFGTSTILGLAVMVEVLEW